MLEKLKISQKILISPLTVLVLFVVVAVLSIATLRSQQEAMDRIVNETHALSTAAEQLETLVADTHSDIMRLMVWHRIDRPQADMDELLETIRASIEQAPATFDAVLELAETGTTPTSLSGPLTRLEGLLNSFLETGGSAAEIAYVNPALATAVITSATDSYMNLRTEVDILLARLAEETALTVEQTERSASRTEYALIAFVVAALAMSALLTIVIGRHIGQGLRTSIDAIGALANGDLDAPIANADRRDEMGDISRGLIVFRRKLKDRTERAAENRRRQQAEAQAALLNDLAGKFEASVTEVVESLASSATELGNAADGMTDMATRSSSGAHDALAAAEAAAGDANSIRKDVAELTDATRTIVDQAGTSTSVVSRAVNQAEDTNVTLSGLAEAAQRIGDVIKIISEIAEQTNLLALNATIEAARAGDAGRGFAVVAQEVKSLANQTATATDEIRRQIEGIQTATAEAVTAITGLTTVIGEISSGTEAIRSSAENQNATTDRMTDAISQVAEAARKAVAKMQTVLSAIEETTEVAEHVQQSSRHLSNETETLANESRQFISGIRNHDTHNL